MGSQASRRGNLANALLRKPKMMETDKSKARPASGVQNGPVAILRRYGVCSIALTLLCTIASASEDPPIPSDDCLLAAGQLVGKSPTGSDLIGSGQSITFVFMPGTPSGVREGKTRSSYAYYGGKRGNSHVINAFTANWIRSSPTGGPPPVTAADLENCAPNALALLISLLAHELLHGTGGCGIHGDPDCAGIAIDIGVAGILCDVITALNECYCDPDCPPMTDSGGNEIPGLGSDADVCAVAQALCARHKEIADRNNSDEGKKKAAACNCSEWSGGSKCPAIPAPAGGCPPSDDPDGGFGNGSVVPPCQGCPPCQCPPE